MRLRPVAAEPLLLHVPKCSARRRRRRRCPHERSAHRRAPPRLTLCDWTLLYSTEHTAVRRARYRQPRAATAPSCPRVRRRRPPLAPSPPRSRAASDTISVLARPSCSRSRRVSRRIAGHGRTRTTSLAATTARLERRRSAPRRPFDEARRRAATLRQRAARLVARVRSGKGGGVGL